MFLIEWDIFHTRYLNSNTIFVKEYDDKWCFYTYDGYSQIKSVKEKSVNTEENISFVDRYMTDKKNFVKIIEIVDESLVEEYTDVTYAEPEEDFEVSLEYGQQ